jgi:hypothetical protein
VCDQSTANAQAWCCRLRIASPRPKLTITYGRSLEVQIDAYLRICCFHRLPPKPFSPPARAHATEHFRPLAGARQPTTHATQAAGGEPAHLSLSTDGPASSAARRRLVPTRLRRERSPPTRTRLHGGTPCPPAPRARSTSPSPHAARARPEPEPAGPPWAQRHIGCLAPAVPASPSIRREGPCAPAPHVVAVCRRRRRRN